MKKTLLALAATALLAYGAQAQTKYSLSEPIPFTELVEGKIQVLKGEYKVLRVLGIDRTANEGYIEYQAIERTAAVLAKYSKPKYAVVDLKTAKIKRFFAFEIPKTKTFGQTTTNSPQDYHAVNVVDDRLLILYSLTDKKQKKVDFYAKSIDLKTMTIAKEKIIVSMDFSKWKAMKRVYKKPNPKQAKLRMSDNKKHIMLFYKIPYSKKDDSAPFWCCVFDKDLNISSAHSQYVQVDLDPKTSRTENMFIDNQGVCYITGYQQNDGYPNRSPVLSVLKPKDKKPKSYTVKIDHNPQDFFPVFVGDNVYVVGHYTPKDMHWSHGTFTCEYLGDKGLSPVTLNPFKKDLIKLVNEGYDIKKWEQDNMGIPHLKYLQTLPKPDGGFYALLEDRRSLKVTSSRYEYRGGPGNREEVLKATSKQKHQLFDAFVVSFNSKGEQEWTTRLHKLQVGFSEEGGPAPNFMSVIARQTDEGVVLYFNEREKFLELKDRQEVKEYLPQGDWIRGANIATEVRITPKGEVAGINAVNGLSSNMVLDMQTPDAAAQGVFLLYDWKSEVQRFMVFEK